MYTHIRCTHNVCVCVCEQHNIILKSAASDHISIVIVQLSPGLSSSQASQSFQPSFSREMLKRSGSLGIRLLALQQPVLSTYYNNDLNYQIL